MRYKKIPNTELNVSVISLGTWVFGDDMWGSADEKGCLDAVSSAIECGINIIDTAPIYGYGTSETRVGKAIKGKRDKVLIATKCGLIGKAPNIKCNLKPDSIRNEIELSLKRLGIDYIDIYQCHWPDPNTPIEETMLEMLNLKKQGKIRYIGVSNFDVNLLEQATNFADITTLQNHYSLLERSIEDKILPCCHKKGIGVLTYGSLGGGILSGKYKAPSKFRSADARSFFYKFYEGVGFKKASKIVDILNKISKDIKRPLNQIALNWLCQKDAVTSAIVGCRNTEQVRMNAETTSWELSQEYIDMLDSLKIDR